MRWPHRCCSAPPTASCGRQILLPGQSVLTRLIATVRERATHRVHSRLA